MLAILAESHWVQMLGLSVVVQVLSWVLAAVLHTEKFYDLVGEYFFLHQETFALCHYFPRLSHIPPCVNSVAQGKHPVG